MGKFNYSVWRMRIISTSIPRTELQQAGMMPVEVEVRTSSGRNCELRKRIITKGTRLGKLQPYSFYV